MQAIRDRGALIVGVSADTLLMGSRNPLSGQIEGFDIDVLHLVSAAMFAATRTGSQFRVITSGAARSTCSRTTRSTSSRARSP